MQFLNTLRRRGLALLLAVLMCMSMLPVSALAISDDFTDDDAFVESDSSTPPREVYKSTDELLFDSINSNTLDLSFNTYADDTIEIQVGETYDLPWEYKSQDSSIASVIDVGKYVHNWKVKGIRPDSTKIYYTSRGKTYTTTVNVRPAEVNLFISLPNDKLVLGKPFSSSPEDYRYLGTGGRLHDWVEDGIEEVNNPTLESDITKHVAEWPSSFSAVPKKDAYSSDPITQGGGSISSNGEVASFDFWIGNDHYTDEKYTIRWVKFSQTDSGKFHVDGALCKKLTAYDFINPDSSEHQNWAKPAKKLTALHNSENAPYNFTFEIVAVNSNGEVLEDSDFQPISLQATVNEINNEVTLDFPVGSTQQNQILTAGSYAIREVWANGTDGEKYWNADPILFDVTTTGLARWTEDSNVITNSPKTYTVTYNPGMNGIFSEQTTRDLQYGDATPAVPDNLESNDPNFEFAGWDENFSNIVTGNVTYTAQWSKIAQHTVKYKWSKAEDESLPDELYTEDGIEVTAAPTLPNDDTVNAGGTHTVSTNAYNTYYALDENGCPTAKYTFDGWYNDDAKVSGDISISSDITLTGKWKCDTDVSNLFATVTFAVVHGTWDNVADDKKTDSISKKVPLKKNNVFTPAAAGGIAILTNKDIPDSTGNAHFLNGTWASDNQNGTIDSTSKMPSTVTGNVTFTITYNEDNSYNVSYYKDGVSQGTSEPEYGDEIAWPADDQTPDSLDLINFNKYSGYTLEKIIVTSSNDTSTYYKPFDNLPKSGTAIALYFETDHIGENDPNTGDGIPDKYQIKVIFNWDTLRGADNSIPGSSYSEVITLKDERDSNAEEQELTLENKLKRVPTITGKNVWDFKEWASDDSEKNIPLDQKATFNGGDVITYTAQFVPNDSRKVIITVEATSLTATYDGTEKSVAANSFEPVTASDGKSYTVTGLTTTGASGKDVADSTPITVIGKENAVVKNGTGATLSSDEYILLVEDGALTINPRSVTLTSATDSKDYDGTALTNSTITVGGDNWANGEGATYTVTGSQLTPGNSKNYFTYQLNNNTTASNYKITTVNGTLTVNRGSEESNPFVRTFHAQSATVTYDGQPHTISGIVGDSFEINGIRYTAQATNSVTATGTNAGTYPLAAPEIRIFEGGRDVTSSFTITTEPGTLTINKRPVTLTSGSSSKVYDGSALTNSTVTVGGMGWVNNDGATYSVTGSQRSVGSSSNAFTYTLNEGTNPDNYDILPVFGTLTIFSDSTEEPEETEPTRRPRDPNNNNNDTTNIDDGRTPQADLTDITDLNTPLADMGLNTTDHYAYLAGFNDGTIRPLNNITRAEVATILFRLMSDNYRTANWATTNSFPDVKPDEWYTTAISTAAKASLMSGDSSGNFRPNDPITRGEFASIAARLASADTVASASFSDTAGHWAESAINTAAGAGWIKGSSGQFRPNAYITRAEAATIVNAMVERHPDKEHLLDNMTVWPDNPETEWYYTAIQEATNTHDYELETQLSESWTKLGEARNWSALMSQWQQAAEQSVPLSNLPVDGLPITGTP